MAKQSEAGNGRKRNKDEAEDGEIAEEEREAWSLPSCWGGISRDAFGQGQETERGRAW